jgi:hypothetical protein
VINNFKKLHLSVLNLEVLATEREPEGQAKRSKAGLRRFFCKAGEGDGDRGLDRRTKDI